MESSELRTARRRAGLTQAEAAERLGISQPYLSLIEKGERPLTPKLAEAAVPLLRLPATARPIKIAPRVTPDTLASYLGALGYPGFAHRRGRTVNPAALLFQALSQDDLDVRVAEALPWVAMTYPGLDWAWLVREMKLKDLQNRLGFVIALARDLAERVGRAGAMRSLSVVLEQLERARLVREDTLGRATMSPLERRHVEERRGATARHWNLLTTLTLDDLVHGG
jgi:transcriptional regulator with XRE-family HTH domain